jgi:glycosyltransferase involved in cell wall biosynthesis
MKILLFNPRIVGHHSEHLRFVANYASKSDDYEVYILGHPDIRSKDKKLDKESRESESVSIFSMKRSEHSVFSRKSSIKRSLEGWKIASRYAMKLDVDHCVFMEVNIYQAVLGLPRARGMSFSTSGILFFPYCRIEPDSDTFLSRLGTAIEKSRKHLQLRWVLSNPDIDTIFLLNDEWGARKLNRDLRTDVFEALPDPVPSFSSGDRRDGELSNWGEKWWGDDRMHFLLFGSLREDKGVRVAIRSFCNLAADDAERAVLHILGEPRENLEEELPELVNDLRQNKPNLPVHFEGRFLSEGELDFALSHSDVILAPYQRTEGSSGVLSHAANYRLPVIGPKTGLVGRLIEQYGLGTTVNAGSADRLRQSISAYLQNADDEWNPAGMRKYVSERSPNDFAGKLLNTLKA